MTTQEAEALAPVIIAVLAVAVPSVCAELGHRTAEIKRLLSPVGSGGRWFVREDGWALASYRNGRAAATLGGLVVVGLCWGFIWAIMTLAGPTHRSWQFVGIAIAVAIGVWFAAVVPVLNAICKLSIAIAPATGNFRLARMVSSGILPLAALAIIIGPAAAYL